MAITAVIFKPNHRFPLSASRESTPQVIIFMVGQLIKKDLRERETESEIPQISRASFKRILQCNDHSNQNQKQQVFFSSKLQSEHDIDQKEEKTKINKSHHKCIIYAKKGDWSLKPTRNA